MTVLPATCPVETNKTYAIPLLEHVKTIIHQYDGFVFDIWGVLFDGVKPFRGTLDCLHKVTEAGKPFVLLTNTPVLRPAMAEKLRDMAIPVDKAAGLITAGSAIQEFMQARRDLLGTRFYYIGRKKFKDLYEGCPGIVQVASLEEADFILVGSLWEKGETLESYRSVLEPAVAAGKPLVCGNPDRVVMIGTQQKYCAGAIAQLYEDMGGTSYYLGKPYPEVYRQALGFMDIPTDHAGRVLAFGDSLATDITGANRAGLDSVLMMTGVHAADLGIGYGGTPDSQELVDLCARKAAQPTCWMPELLW